MQDSNELKTNSTSRSVTVRSYGRLHFGLSEICPTEPNCFGGIGLMIDHSRAEIEATVEWNQNSSAPSQEPSVHADEYWQSRIQSFLTSYRHNQTRNQTHREDSKKSLRSIALRSAPLPHCGLGSGTQMACTLSVLLCVLEGLEAAPTESFGPDWSMERILQSSASPTPSDSAATARQILTRISGRGMRSNIGLQGFIEGGFIVDHGIESDVEPRRTDRFAFPSDWPIVLVRDITSEPGDSGPAEVAMFARCSTRANNHRNTMQALVSNEIVPSMLDRDWKTFDRSLSQYGQLAGSIFEPAQGGIYRTEKIANTVSTIQKLGILGAVQSSWGPTVACFARDLSHANWCCDQLTRELPSANASIVYAANRSAEVICR